MIQGFLTWLRLAGLVLFISVGLKGCALKQEIACNCEQESLDTWTSEFIHKMKAGEMPENADQYAVAQSVKVFNGCMNKYSIQ